MIQAIRIQSRSPAIRVPMSLVGALPDRRADDIAAISHELRNSLAVVRNAARLLRAPANSTHVDNARVLIDRHVAQMPRHIDDLLDTASQAGSKKGELFRSH